MLRETLDETANGFTDHLAELSRRILIAVTAIILGAVLGWLVYPQAYQLVAGPVLQIIQAHDGQVFTLQPAEAFLTRCKLSVALGLVLASPMVIWQLWAFVRPALLPHERRAVRPLMPAISVLFILGVGLAYLMMPNIVRFLLSYVPAGVNPNMDFQSSINFPMKIMLGFGLAFQLPILLIGLVALRILSPQLLLQQWRTAVVAMAVIAAVVTPTADPFNWALLMTPLLVLYFGTVAVAFGLMRKGRDDGHPPPYA